MNTPPPLYHPRALSLGMQLACAIDDYGVKCWGHKFQAEDPLDIPPLFNPRQIAVGIRNLCALVDNGVSCWGEGPVNVPDSVQQIAYDGMLGGSVLIENLDRAFSVLARNVYSYKREFLQIAAKESAALPATSKDPEDDIVLPRMLIAQAVVPVLQQTKSLQHDTANRSSRHHECPS